MSPRRDVRTQLEPVELEAGAALRLDASNCRSCEAPIIWCRTRSGKSMPVDAEPTARGDFFLSTAADGKVEVCHVRLYPGELPHDLDRYTSHFATCDQPERFRR